MGMPIDIPMDATMERSGFPVEKCEEAAEFLKAAVLSPMEDMAWGLQKSWTGDEASKVFLTHAASHMEALRAAHQLLKEAAREMADMQD